MEGAVLTTLTVPLLDRAVTATAVRLRPWMGKRFAAGGTAGHNLLRPWAGRTLRLAWPRYRPTREGQAIAAFRFETRIERSVEAPEAEVMVLDYAVASNPRLVIRGIRDELVEVVPGVCLGKAYRLDRRGRHLLAGYFALRPDRR
jgi:hypothetical protein